MYKQNQEKNKKNKSVVIPIILTFLLLLVVITTTYAVFIYSKEGVKKNVVSTGTLTFTFEETSNGISLTNALPISDSIGKTLTKDENNNGYFDFNVSCRILGTDVIKYDIYATSVDENNTLPEEYVKIYLTDGNTDNPLEGYEGEVPTYDKLKGSTSSLNAKQLYYGTFSATGNKSFRLRIWVADNYSVPSSEKQFKIKINVNAVN